MALGLEVSDGAFDSWPQPRAARHALTLKREAPIVRLQAGGKGHERRQLIDDRTMPWSDVDAATELLEEMGYR